MHGTITASNRADGAAPYSPSPCRPRMNGDSWTQQHERGPPSGPCHRRRAADPKLLRLGLNANGYQTLEAPNGRTALKLLCENPDLIILDLGLPDMQGHDLLRRSAPATRTCRSSFSPAAATKPARSRRSTRRRRLCHQTVRHGRTVGPDARGAAPPIADPRRAAGVPGRRSLRRSWCAASSKAATRT